MVYNTQQLFLDKIFLFLLLKERNDHESLEIANHGCTNILKLSLFHQA